MRTRFGLWSILLLALGVASTSGAQVLPTSSGPRASDSSARAAEPAGRVVGTVIDEYNAISLPGVPVEVIGLDRVVYTDLDGKYILELGAGTYQIKVEFPGSGSACSDRSSSARASSSCSATSSIEVGPADRLRPDSALRASSRSRRSASRGGGQGDGGPPKLHAKAEAGPYARSTVRPDLPTVNTRDTSR